MPSLRDGKTRLEKYADPVFEITVGLVIRIPKNGSRLRRSVRTGRPRSQHPVAHGSLLLSVLTRSRLILQQFPGYL